MEMTEEEIIRYYRNARSKKKAERVLADENGCGLYTIRKIVNPNIKKRIQERSNYSNDMFGSKEDMQTSFTARLEDLMKTNNLNSKELAIKSNMPQSSISAYLSGYRLPDTFSLYKMSVVLGVTIDSLLMGDKK